MLVALLLPLFGSGVPASGATVTFAVTFLSSSGVTIIVT